MDLQDLLLGMYFVEVTIELELFLFFILGWRREEREKKRDIASILGLYFLLLAIGRIILIIHDFHFTADPLWLAGMGVSLLGMISFIVLAEKIIPKNTYYLFTILSCLTLLSIFFVDDQTAKNILYLMLPLLFLIGFVFLGYLIRRTAGSVRYNFTLVFIGQFIIGIGHGFNTDWISGWFSVALGFNIKPIGLSLIIGGLVFMALSFWRLPSFGEIEWHGKMLSLYVITEEHGLCCLYYPFQKEMERRMAPQLISGGVSGILTLVKEMTSSKMHLKEIDHEDIKILFEYGLYSTTVLLVEEDLQVYHYKLRQFVEEFETQFKENLIKWSSEISIFQPALDIVGRIFEQKPEKLEPSTNEATSNDMT